jgi:hypothetical protein
MSTHRGERVNGKHIVVVEEHNELAAGCSQGVITGRGNAAIVGAIDHRASPRLPVELSQHSPNLGTLRAVIDNDVFS